MSKLFQTVATVFSLSLAFAVMSTPFFVDSAEAKGFNFVERD